MEPTDRRFEKGSFTPNRFPVAAKYPTLSSRSKLFRIGAVAGLVLALTFVADAFIRGSTMVAGDLSDSHALFANDCSTCHTPLAGATNASCESCHQTSGADRRVYAFSRHYQYQSADLDRSGPKSSEATCASCHVEHRGREQVLYAVANDKCTSCHEVGSLRRHPEFEFVAKQTPDPANLLFPHVLHVREVMDEKKLVDAEQACLHCHTPRPDGRFFQPITFAKACDGCHLAGSESTPYVPLRSGGRPGVVSLAEIRRSGGPGTQWADYWNADEFSEQDGAMRKRPVFHEDPWVLHNLSRLRRELYPTAELADLLRTSPELPPAAARTLYEEAIATLEGQIASLRASPSPDVQRELEGLTELLKVVRARIDDPYAPMDETRFAVSPGDRAAGADEQAYGTVIDSLTKPCQTCHVVARATIRRVQTDQRSLVRAEFDHRAHVIHARCLDCHSGIPFREFLASGDDVPPERDRAEILNVPGIATCRTCHSSRTAPSNCTSCHLFHPDKSHWAALSR